MHIPSSLRSAYGVRLLFDPGFARAALGLVLVFALAARSLLFIQHLDEIHWGYDFSAYFWAGERVLAGGSPYAAFQLAGTYSPQHPQGLYIYPPFLAAAVSPLSVLFDDFRAANWVWVVVGLAIAIATAVAVGRREGIRHPADVALLVGGTISFAPVVGELLLGNVHMLILGLLAGGWLAVRRGTAAGQVAAGALVGAATLIKLFPGVLILWFLLTGRVRAAAAAVVSMGVLSVATLPFTGLGPWLEFPTVILNLGPPDDLRNVLAPAAWLTSVMPPLVARVVVTLAGMALLVWVARERSDAVSYGAAVVISILIAPALYHHYLAILVLPMILSLRHSRTVGWVLAAYLLLSAGEQSAYGDLAWVVNRGLPTLGVLLMLIGLLVWGRSRPAGRSGPALPQPVPGGT